MQGNVIESNIQTPRLYFVDNLRIFLTLLVIAHHAGQPYGPTGGTWPISNSEHASILGAFFAVNAAFFMGLFFLISGYFLPGAYDRKGAKVFLTDRVLRLGIPTIFLAIVVFPPVLFFLAEPRTLAFGQFLFQVYLRQRQIQIGHLWFLVHLLFYAICYAGWRLAKGKSFNSRQSMALPDHRVIVLYIAALTLVTFAIRIQYPIDTWKELFWVIPAEVAHLPQYISLFVLGVISYRQNWLQQMPTQRGFIWLGIGLGAALLRYGYSWAGNQLFPVRIIATGGLSWQSFLWSLWEAIICVGLCIGLLVLFRQHLNSQGKLTQILSVNAYVVYLIHIFVVIAIQLWFASSPISPLFKFVLVTLISTSLCFLLSHYLRKSPLISNSL